MNTAEIIFVLIAIFLIGLYLVWPSKNVIPDESNARVRMNQTHPEPEQIKENKIIPSRTSDLISMKRFDKVSPEQIMQLNEDYLELVRRLNEEVIF